MKICSIFQKKAHCTFRWDNFNLSNKRYSVQLIQCTKKGRKGEKPYAERLLNAKKKGEREREDMEFPEFRGNEAERERRIWKVPPSSLPSSN